MLEKSDFISSDRKLISAGLGWGELTEKGDKGTFPGNGVVCILVVMTQRNYIGQDSSN